MKSRRSLLGSTARRLTLAVSNVALVVLAGATMAAAESSPAAKDKMVVEAKELIDNQDKNTVSAQGDVKVYYQGRLLEADHVTYDRASQRVIAQGHAKLTETDGSIVRAERFELQDNFKAGFIDSLQADTKDALHMSAPRSEIIGDHRIYDKATYTACESCRDHPEKPRLWQIKAKRIIHDKKEKMLYFEDASFEFMGTPIAYIPYIAEPDPTVKRKTGFLMPSLMTASYIGAGVKTPFYWEISPDADMTLSPGYFTKAGIPYLSGEFRKRFDNGDFSVRMDGAYLSEAARQNFAPEPYGARDRSIRGDISSRGKFDINDRWKFGWQGAYFTDRYFVQDFGMYNILNSAYYFRESTSEAYLTGQGPRSFFDVRSYYFQGLLPGDIQGQIPVTHPMGDYNRTFDIDPAKTAGIGGQVEIDSNFTSLSENLPNYQSIQPQTLDSQYALYNVCQTYSPNINPNLSQCLLRGIAGNYQRVAASAAWKRKAIDPIGGVWTPFAFVRGMGSYVDYNTSGTYNVYNYANMPIPNAAQQQFLPGMNNTLRGQVTPGMGVDWRYPLLATSPVGNVVIEPIAQVIARPNQTSIPTLVNMDAQSLVFDDSTLFEWNKFSGYDRFETGTRINYGAQATLNFANGGFINTMIGQSQQIIGDNAYASADAANVGLASGLNTRVSDIVGRTTIAPASFLTFTAKGRFANSNFNPRRIDLISSLKLNPLTINIQYANYIQQPQIGFEYRRQGLMTSAFWDITKNYFVNGSVTFDMSRGGAYDVLYTATKSAQNSWFASAMYGVGGGYQDDCFSLTANYSSAVMPWYTGQNRNQTLFLALNLRSLGETKFSQNVGTLLHDGVGTSSTTLSGY